MPKVSVILPNYNHAKYLPQRIESIFNQSFTDFELIVLDDNSSDNSIEVIESYLSDKRFTHFVKNQMNSGSTFIQWEKGIQLAQGEYIWIAESDDVAAPSFLSDCLEKISSTPGVEIVYVPSVWIDENGKEIHSPEHESVEKVWNGNNLITSEFLTGNLIYNASSAVFRKDLLKNVDFGAVRTFRYTGDWLFWVQLISNSKVARLGKRLNYFRRHTGNVSFRSDSEGLLFTEGIRIVNYILKNYPVTFIARRKTALRWAKKLTSAVVTDKQKVKATLPLEIRLYFTLFNLVK